MKQLLTLLLISCAFITVSFAQQNQWAWMNGDILPQVAVYGVKGKPTASNKPGARRNAAIWTDNAGNSWVFGGAGSTTTDLERASLSDLWKFMPSTGQWTWMGGDSISNATGVYGTKGIAAPNNKPGARLTALSWTDKQGNLWLFGGRSFTATEFLQWNDLWKYSPSTGQWTWVSGDSTAGRTGVYGVKGVEAASNKPGSRDYSTGTTDASGNFWLYGGYGLGASRIGNLNDLWKFSPATQQWTWISGDSSVGHAAVFGTKGVAADKNKPSYKSQTTCSMDASGNFWLFSGYSSRGVSDDLWKYSTSNGQWTWVSGDTLESNELVTVYGTKGTPSASTKPNARTGAVSWTDEAGSLYIFGGAGRVVGGFRGYSGWFNDLWRFTPATGLWTWVSGDNSIDPIGVHGTKGKSSPTNRPGSREQASAYKDASGNFWLFGGEGSSRTSPGVSNDLWKYDVTVGEWTWMGGDDNYRFAGGIYGTRGIASPANKPGARYDANSWTDVSGNLWLFGGTGKAAINIGGLNDLWRYEIRPGQWTWMNGDTTINSKAVFGTKGLASPANKPRNTGATARWADSSGNLWLFSGSGSDDLWKYSTVSNEWTWMNGDTIRPPRPVYGTKGIAAPGNTPGARQASLSWTDPAGNFWLYGGTLSSPASQIRTDIWKYIPSINQWAWMGGDTTGGNSGVYGTKGIASPANKPGARNVATGWTDKSGDFWLFGGIGQFTTVATIYNDLWKYSISTGQWTWISGDSSIRNPGIYGTRGIPSPSNKPGARFNAVGSIDASGNLWLMGGSSIATYDNLNDLWKFVPSTGQWTWMSGDSSTNATGNYGNQGEFSPSNKPPARTSAVSWSDKAGSLWIFGGYKLTRLNEYYGDLWMYSTAVAPIPLFQFLSFTARKQSVGILLNWTSAQEKNLRYYVVERSSSGLQFDSIGSVAAGNSQNFNYAFTDPAPLKRINHYRLKAVEQNGRITYSTVQAVIISEDDRFVLLQNPVQQTLRIKADLSASGKITLQVRDVAGRLLINKTESVREGSSVYSISVGHLAKGNYLITVQSVFTKITKPFIRQ
nr:Galactose oxidase, central domain [uncultured organism]